MLRRLNSRESSSIIAGLQIALTQPVNIGDNVLFEGNWGNVESISYTYVTILTWDQRRIIVPLRYLLSHPIENWSKKDSHLINPIVLHVDYRIDVERVRKTFEKMQKDAEEWDETTEPVLQVLESREETIVLRALCSAKTPAAAWNLYCRLREQLNEYVQKLEDGKYLPRKRVCIENADSGDRETEDGAQAQTTDSWSERLLRFRHAPRVLNPCREVPGWESLWHS